MAIEDVLSSESQRQTEEVTDDVTDEQ
jgi:hypothetical protein